MAISVRKYEDKDLSDMIRIWNEVVEDGVAFPQETPLDKTSGKEFFAAQTYCGVAVTDSSETAGLYILHPNNVGRCGHIANASYAVARSARGMGAGKPRRRKVFWGIWVVWDLGKERLSHSGGGWNSLFARRAKICCSSVGGIGVCCG